MDNGSRILWDGLPAHLPALDRRIVQVIGDGIISLDADGRVTSANPATGALTSYRAQELVGAAGTAGAFTMTGPVAPPHAPPPGRGRPRRAAAQEGDR